MLANWTVTDGYDSLRHPPAEILDNSSDSELEDEESEGGDRSQSK